MTNECSSRAVCVVGYCVKWYENASRMSAASCVADTFMYLFWAWCCQNDEHAESKKCFSVVHLCETWYNGTRNTIQNFGIVELVGRHIHIEFEWKWFCTRVHAIKIYIIYNKVYIYTNSDKQFINHNSQVTFKISTISQFTSSEICVREFRAQFKQINF